MWKIEKYLTNNLCRAEWYESSTGSTNNWATISGKLERRAMLTRKQAIILWLPAPGARKSNYGARYDSYTTRDDSYTTKCYLTNEIHRTYTRIINQSQSFIQQIKNISFCWMPYRKRQLTKVPLWKQYLLFFGSVRRRYETLLLSWNVASMLKTH